MIHKLILNATKFQFFSAKRFGAMEETSRGWIPPPIQFRVIGHQGFESMRWSIDAHLSYAKIP